MKHTELAPDEVLAITLIVIAAVSAVYGVVVVMLLSK